jgi:signal peptidase I
MRARALTWATTLGSAIAYAVLIGTFGLQSARVAGASMAPTLEDQDRCSSTGSSIGFVTHMPATS